VSSFLRTRGYDVTPVRSGIELLSIVPSIQPDIVIVDIQMPGMDGIETTRRLRAMGSPALAAVPIVAVTALVMSGDKEKCLAAGANEYISKPFVLAQLDEMIRDLLTGKRA
jgi:CheY-like chemotaxis protein